MLPMTDAALVSALRVRLAVIAEQGDRIVPAAIGYGLECDFSDFPRN
jgi:hypothetical protein